MSFDKWREWSKQKKKSAERLVKLTINYSYLEPIDFMDMDQAFALRPGQLVIVVPWSLLRSIWMDKDRLSEVMSELPGYECSVLEVL